MVVVETEYMRPEDIGKPLPVTKPPVYRPPKKENIITWIDSQKQAKLIRILFVVCLVLLFIGTMLWGFSYVRSGYIEGGVVESESRLAHFMGGLTVKAAFAPFL